MLSCLDSTFTVKLGFAAHFLLSRSDLHRRHHMCLIIIYMNTKKLYKSIIISALSVIISASACFTSFASEADENSGSAGYAANVSDYQVGTLMLPSDSTQASSTLALQLLALSSGNSKENTDILFGSSSLEILAQNNFDKDSSDPADTCAYTIGHGTAACDMSPVEALVVSIRGTNGGEWYSNFNTSASHNDDSAFADGFLFSAEDIFLTLKEYIDAYPDARIIICGHSRGGSCANLLGVLVDEYCGSNNVYVYTYAAAATVRTGTLEDEYNNIFNFINPCDIVPMVPLPDWDYVRAGTDITLSVDNEDLYEDVQRYTDILSALAPSVTSYYCDRHSLTSSGLDENGLTSYELMLMISDKLISILDKYTEEEISSLLSSSGTESGDDNIEAADPSSQDIDLSGLTISDSALSEDSDFYPLYEIYTEISDNDFELGRSILLQHLPTTYIELIKSWAIN